MIEGIVIAYLVVGMMLWIGIAMMPMLGRASFLIHAEMLVIWGPLYSSVWPVMVLCLPARKWFGKKMLKYFGE